MGASSKRKGSVFERELVARHTALGVRSHRVPMSGALAQILGPDYADDVVVGDPKGEHFRCECKKRGGGGG